MIKYVDMTFMRIVMREFGFCTRALDVNFRPTRVYLVVELGAYT
jgi:hypothetical protein